MQKLNKLQYVMMSDGRFKSQAQLSIFLFSLSMQYNF